MDGEILHRALNGSVKSSRYLLLALAVVPTAYSFVHLGAISMEFPTAIEKTLWQASCYYLIASAGALGLYFLLAGLAEDLMFKSAFWLSVSNFMKRKMKWSMKLFLSTFNIGEQGEEFLSLLPTVGFFHLRTGICSVHLAARIYLVVESFILLRHVPIGVYQLPPLNIMGNVPHL